MKLKVGFEKTFKTLLQPNKNFIEFCFIKKNY